MRVSNRFAVVITALVLVSSPTVSHAWNYTGHRVIASTNRFQDDEGRRSRSEREGAKSWNRFCRSYSSGSLSGC
jgi:hypothetical protein